MSRLCSLGLFLLLTPALNAGWAPLPPSVWALKEDPAKGIRDAAVLEETATFDNNHSEFSFRVRVFTEAGKKAVQFPLPPLAYDFQGRTVTPDGNQTVFNSRKDCTTTTVSARSGFERKETVVIPPGVTSDCIVEMSFKRPGNAPWGPLEPGLDQLEVDFGGPFYTVRSVIKVSTTLGWPWVLTGSQTPPKETRDFSHTTLTYENLPAQDTEPYALDAVEGIPRLTIYYQPSSSNYFRVGTEEEYWSKALGRLVKNYYQEEVTKGRAMDALTAEILNDLEGLAPEAKAAAIYTRLQAAWVDRNRLTNAEKAARPTDYDKKAVDPRDLETAAKRKETDAGGMRIALFMLLKLAGLKPQVGMVADRGQRIFNPHLRNIFQLDGELIGVPIPGKDMLWLDPGMRFGDPGLIHPAYQGTPGLVFDGATWAKTDLLFPVQPPKVNQTVFEYWLNLGDEDQPDALRCHAQFTGFPAWYRRMDLLASEPVEQNRNLKEAMEKKIGGFKVEQAEVTQVTEGGKALSWELKGTLDREEGRRRQVVPFPGMPSPLAIPEHLPKDRTANIFIPYLRSQVAVSHILVPAGYRIGELKPIVRNTAFGTASWSATVKPNGDMTEITATLKIVVNRFSTSPAGYTDLKYFLAGIDDVCGATLVLEKTDR